MSPGRDAPLTHRLTLVSLNGEKFIADVGFGGQTPTWPLLLEPNVEQQTPHGAYRFVRDGEMYESQFRLRDEWAPMYRFTLTPLAPIDFEVANWFTSTHPQALFVRNLLVARVIGETRVNLRNNDLVVRALYDSVEHRSLGEARQLREVLEGTMRLAWPAPSRLCWSRLPKEPAPSL